MASPFAAQTLTSRAVIRLAGESPLDFLHNLLTCQLAGLPERTWAYGALLSAQGKIQHDVFVIHDGGTVFVDCAASQATGLLQKLKLYRLRAKIEITVDESLAVAVGTNEGLAAPDPRIPAMGLRALVPTGSLPAGEGYGAHRIANGLADSDADIGENQLFPHEANFDLLHGVSFTKGCYIGQEPVARLHYKGRPNRHLRGLRPGGPVAHGDPVRLGDRQLGEVGTAVLSPASGRIALSILRKEAEPGSVVTVETEAGEVEAEVVELPFIEGSGI